jgi:hypothetical protein
MSCIPGHPPDHSPNAAATLDAGAAPSVGSVEPCDAVVSNGVNAALKALRPNASHRAQVATSLRMEPRYSGGFPSPAKDSHDGEAINCDRPRTIVAFGPELPGIGSWEWVGHDLADALDDRFKIVMFRDEPPECDVLVLIKWRPSFDILRRTATRSAIIYCPVDLYGSAAEIDLDWRALRLCQRIIAHCPDLARYFGSYAPVEVLDHHVKYATPLRNTFLEDGPIVWTGVWANLPPLVDWVNSHPLPAELCILTNLNDHDAVPAQTFGFTDHSRVRIENWTPDRHVERLSQARAVLDIKGQDFRARHKPAAKAVDCIASGVPLAMNADSCSTAYLRTLGFEIAAPDDLRLWLSREYWEQTRVCGAQLRERMSLAAVAGRMAQILNDVRATREAVCPSA